MMNNGWRKTNAAAGANRQNPLIRDLPRTLFCCACEEDLELHQFSTTQLEKVQEWYTAMKEAKAVGTRVDATKKFQPTCIECTPKQVHKLTCKICNKTMELDKFSKAQRRMAAKDNGARCLKCVTLREDLDWVHDAVPGTIRYEPDDDEEEAMEAGGLPPF